MDRLAVPKPDLCFRGMDVDIDQVRRQLQEEKSGTIAPRHKQTVVRFGQRMTPRAVANPTAIDEQILHPRRAAIAAWVGDIAVQASGPLLRLDGQEFVADFVAEEQANAFGQSGRGGNLED